MALFILKPGSPHIYPTFVSRNFHANLGTRIVFATILAIVTSIPVKTFAFNLEGQNAPRANSGTNWSGGPLRGWNELEFIPCRVVLQPGNNQLVTINFDHTKNSSIVKRGIQDLFYFSSTANVQMTTPVVTGVTSTEDWYYTFTANVTNNQTGYVYFYARMCAGAHLFGGSSLALFNPPLQIMKPGPVSGNPDLIVIKTGPDYGFRRKLLYILTYLLK